MTTALAVTDQWAVVTVPPAIAACLLCDPQPRFTHLEDLQRHMHQHHPTAVGACTCGHLEAVHNFGRRGGRTIRTDCSHRDETGDCPCKRYTTA